MGSIMERMGRKKNRGEEKKFSVEENFTLDGSAGDDKIRVAQIMGKLWAGGVENVVFNYYRQMDKSKVEFDFFIDDDSTVEPPEDLLAMGAHFYKIPRYQKLPFYLKTLKGYLKRNRYNIVHSHINTISIFPLYVAWRAKIPIRIAHSHSILGGKELKKNLLKLFLRMFAKIFPTDYFACSEQAGRWMFGKRTFQKGNVHIVRNSIDFDKFRLSEEILQHYRTKLKLENKFVICHIGRFTYAKNHKFLLEIFYEFLKTNENAILLLVGDGELHDDIVDEIDRLNLREYVILTGKVPDSEKYYRLADIVILPSFYEGLPLVVLESQIAGVPVLVSEAIPDEAVISNSVMKMSLDDSAEEWAHNALVFSKQDVTLNTNSELYNIKISAPELTAWYQERVRSYRMRKRDNA